jgi:hypothetical protein
MNESDHAVIVNLSTDRPRTVVLPAHSRAVLSEDWSGPTEDRPWRLTVLDDSCAELTSITVTHGYLNLHVAADGSIAWDHVRTYRPTPSGIRPAGQLEDAACG